jgi:hypothetical protein
METSNHSKNGATPKSLTSRKTYKFNAMAKTTTRPPNGPSTTGKPSGGGRGNNPPAPKPKGK